MPFRDHSHLVNAHATLSASNNAWTNYDLETLETRYRAKLATAHGTEMHEFAATCIRLKQTLEDTGQTLNTYVNDAVGFRMSPEVVLFYSMDAFGTADAIDDRDEFLRIFDLKTGLGETSFRQLEVYATYYCLEYKKDPMTLKGMEFRIYQNDEIKVMEGDPLVIKQLMEHTKICSAHIVRMRAEAE
jgi:hypothetical protein